MSNATWQTHQANQARIAERVGDGTAYTAEQFARAGYTERAALAKVNLDRYRELAAQEEASR